MLAVKNIVIELISAVLCGVAIGLAMAITANAFVEAAVYANEYRNSLPWLEVNFGSSTYSLSSIFSLLLAALLITWLRKWLNISHWQGPAD